MANILQTTFSKVFYWINDFVFVKKIIKVSSLCNGLIYNVNIVSGEIFLSDGTNVATMS